jgi:hypothetical protein
MTGAQHSTVRCPTDLLLQQPQRRRLDQPAVGPQRRLVGQAQVVAQPSQEHAGADSARVLQDGASPGLHSRLDGLLRHQAGWSSVCTLAIPHRNHGRLVLIDHQTANCPAGYSYTFRVECTWRQLGADAAPAMLGSYCALPPSAGPSACSNVPRQCRCIITSRSKRRGTV